MAAPGHNVLADEEAGQQPPQVELAAQRPQRYIEDSEASSIDEAERAVATRILLNLEENAKPYVMSR